jgi:hypothetical protein
MVDEKESVVLLLDKVIQVWLLFLNQYKRLREVAPEKLADIATEKFKTGSPVTGSTPFVIVRLLMSVKLMVYFSGFFHAIRPFGGTCGIVLRAKWMGLQVQKPGS